MEKLQEELDRKLKASKGRQKARDKPEKELDFGDFAIVSPISKRTLFGKIMKYAKKGIESS